MDDVTQTGDGLKEQLSLLLAYQEAHPDMGDGPEARDVGTMSFASYSTIATTGAQTLLNAARAEIGYCRWDDLQAGTRYGRWYGSLVGDSYYGASGVPFCMMFVSWCLKKVGAAAPGFPGAYCPWGVSTARNAGRAKRASQARAGDVVFFDWGGDGVSDHVGLVESNNTSRGTLTCVEGNTTGPDGRSGSVARKVRYYSNVVCCVTPTFATSSTTTKPSTPTTKPSTSTKPSTPAKPTKPATPATKPAEKPKPTVVPKEGPDEELTMPQRQGAVHRLYNPNDGDHLYTTDANEARSLASKGWKDEGALGVAPAGLTDVYRFVNASTGQHILTDDFAEAEALLRQGQNLSDGTRAGWQYEGVAFVARDGDGGPVRVHRLYREGAPHLLTADENEVKTLVAKGWKDEGVKFSLDQA